MLPLRIYLRENFNCKNEEIIEILREIEQKIFNDTKKNIARNMRDVSGKIIEQFKKKFCYEKSTDYQEQKNWERYEELEIDFDFKKLREEYLPIFDQLKFFELMKDILSIIKFEQLPDKISLETEECQKIVEQYSKNNNFEILLKQGDILTLRKKFEMEISDILEDVKRKKEGFKMNIPYWFYALLIFFGYDDAFKLSKSWYIIPILIIGGSYFLLVKLKKDWIIKDSYFFVEEKADKVYRKLKKFLDEKYRIFKLKYNFSI